MNFDASITSATAIQSKKSQSRRRCNRCISEDCMEVFTKWYSGVLKNSLKCHIFLETFTSWAFKVLAETYDVFRRTCLSCRLNQLWHRFKISYYPWQAKPGCHLFLSPFVIPPVCKKRSVDLLVVTIWLKFYTSYSFCCHHHFRHP